jgi:uncharacterized protein (TIGR02271 family)
MANSRTLALAHEEVEVGKRKTETGRVRVRKVVRQHEALVDEALLREDVEVQRVPVNRPAKGVPAPHYEGEILVIPVVEEVLVVSKQLMVKEELRIRRRAKRSPHRQRVLLRSEVAVVEREPAVTGAGRRPSNGKGAQKWRRQ